MPYLNICGLYADGLQGLVSSLEKKVDETEKKFEETRQVSEERLKQALDAESKIVQLKTAMHRFVDLPALLSST